MLLCLSAATGAHRQARDSQQQQQEQQQELAAALVAAEATNDRLRAIIAALRQEMEELQAASEWASGSWAVPDFTCGVVVLLLLSMQRMQSCQRAAEMDKLQAASKWAGAAAMVVVVLLLLLVLCSQERCLPYAFVPPK
jgi:hypothetical protein